MPHVGVRVGRLALDGKQDSTYQSSQALVAASFGEG